MRLATSDLDAIGLQSLEAAYRFNLGAARTTEYAARSDARTSYPAWDATISAAPRTCVAFPSKRTHGVPDHRRTAARMLVVLALMLALAACGDIALSPSNADPSPTTAYLSAIACATDDPTGVGGLTGAWSGSTGGVYYIRQVGHCVWWFGTEIESIETGLTGQAGFANVASGRVDGTHIEVEYADLPVGNVLGGGGLTFFYDEQNGQLVLIEQRGDWQAFGDSVLTRIEPNASPDPTSTASSTP